MENKRFRALKRKPNGRPTVITVFDGQQEILEVWVSHEIVAKADGTTEEQSTVHAKTPKKAVDFYGGQHKARKDPSRTIRDVVAAAILSAAYGQAQALRFHDTFAEVVLKKLPVSQWRFNEPDLFTGILECQQFSLKMQEILDVGNAVHQKTVQQGSYIVRVPPSPSVKKRIRSGTR